MQLRHVVYVLLALSSRLSRAAASAKGLTEYCTRETFKAACAQNEVVVIEVARFGRMRMGRCVKNDLGYIGCFSDVTKLLDHKCSGRRSCIVSVPDKDLDDEQPCLEDLKSYLETSYNCTPVVWEKEEVCKSSSMIEVTKQEGYLSSVVAAQTGCGAAHAPWRITAKPGQTIDIRLIDFSLPWEPSSSQRNCPMYATLKEEPMSLAQQVVCGGRGKNRHVYTTMTHVVDVQINTRGADAKNRYFLLHFKVKGCADPTLASSFSFNRKRNSVQVLCQASGESWILKCVEGNWIGSVGNCSIHPQSQSDVDSIWNLSLSTGATVALIIGVSLLIGSIILVVGLMYLRRHQREESLKKSKHPTHTCDLIYGPVINLKSTCRDQHGTLHDESSPYGRIGKSRRSLNHGCGSSMDAANTSDEEQPPEYTHEYPGMVTFCTHTDSAVSSAICPKHAGLQHSMARMSPGSQTIKIASHTCDDFMPHDLTQLAAGGPNMPDHTCEQIRYYDPEVHLS